MATAPSASLPAWMAHRVITFEGQHDTHIQTGEEYRTASLAHVFDMKPTQRPKAKSWAFLPSSYCEYDAREHAAQREHGSFVALCGDIDEGDHDLAHIEDLVDEFTGNAARRIYSSAHARLADMRWRIIIPLAEPIGFQAWEDAELAFFGFMEGRGVKMDHALARAGQPVYLPNVPTIYAKTGEVLRNEAGPLYFQDSTRVDAPGLDLDCGPVEAAVSTIRAKRETDDRLRELLRQQALQRRLNRPSDGDSLIDGFNRENSVADLLAHYGYEQSPRRPEDWRSPYQTSGSYATRVIESKFVSLSASDAAAGLGATFASGVYGDAYDLFTHFEHGGDHREAFRQLRREVNDADPAHPQQDSSEPTEPKESRLLPLVDIASWKGDPPKRLSFWGDWLPASQTTMLTGRGGIGKSLFEQCLFTAIALGEPFLGMETRQRNTLYITCEDDEPELWRRQDAINDAFGITRADLFGRLFLCSLMGETDTALATFNSSGRLSTTPRWQEVVATCEAHRIGLYAFDNATDAMAGDLNDLHQVAEFVNLLTGLAKHIDGAAMVLHHPNKAGDDWLGSVAWHNKVRSRLIIEDGDEHDPDSRVVRNPKANYGPQGGKVEFRWHAGAFVRDEDLGPDRAAQLRELSVANAQCEAFLACLRQRAKEGVERAVGASPGPNYAPSQFEGMPEAKGYKRQALKGAMDRLFRTGRITTEAVTRPGKSDSKTIIVELPETFPNAVPNASRTRFPNAPEPAPNSPEDTLYISKIYTGAAHQPAAPCEGEGQTDG